MAVFLVTFNGKQTLVEAAKERGAVNHIVKGAVSAVALKPAEVAHHMKNGVEFETAANDDKVVETKGNAAPSY